MKIVVLGDIHSNLDVIKDIRDDLVEAECIILTGNITRHGDWLDAKRIIERLMILNPRILAVMGRNDNKTVLEYLKNKKISIHGQGRAVNHVGIYGVGGGNVSLFSSAIEYSGKEQSDFLYNGYKDVKDCQFFIIVSHTPPYNTRLDMTSQNEHVGSRALRSFIFKYTPNVFVSSNVHGGAIIDRYGPTYLASPGPLDKGGFIVINPDLSFPVTIKQAANITQPGKTSTTPASNR